MQKPDEVTQEQPSSNTSTETESTQAAHSRKLMSRKKMEAHLRSLKYTEAKAKAKAKKLEKLLGQKSVITDTVEDLPPSVREVAKENVIFEPNNGPQTDFLAASEDEVFYGGARGGGKSMAIIVDPLRYCNKSIHRALIIRRTMPELRDLIAKSQQLYPKAFPGAKWREQEKEWRFPSGARIEFGYAENLQDALRYQGQNYTAIYFDELPQYPNAEVYNFICSSLRSTDPEVPALVRASGNPGNVGSQWVKEMFIDPAPPNAPFKVEISTPLGKKYISRRFIPAKLQDNKYLTQTDDYLIRLASLPEIQRRQFLEGDWDAYDGAAFSEFRRDKHVVSPFDIPRSWIRFRACDWGYTQPACVLWFAVDYDGRLYVYRELYTTKVTADKFAEKILELEGNEPIRFAVMDSSVWARRGDPGPPIAEVINNILRGAGKMTFRPADRSPGSRVSGKLEIHRRLALTGPAEQSNLRIFNTCQNLIRTLPMLPLDKTNQEDVDTDFEDHAYDALRYGCMSRPVTPNALADLYSTMLTKKRSLVKQSADQRFGY